MRGRAKGVDTQIVDHHWDEVIQARENGESCRVIAERLGVPEYTIHSAMRRTGNAGRWRAKQHHRRTGGGKIPFANLIRYIEEAAEEVVIEKSADETGWIVTIDDLSGEQKDKISTAMRSAYQKWRGV